MDIEPAIACARWIWEHGIWGNIAMTIVGFPLIELARWKWPWLCEGFWKYFTEFCDNWHFFHWHYDDGSSMQSLKFWGCFDQRYIFRGKKKKPKRRKGIPASVLATLFPILGAQKDANISTVEPQQSAETNRGNVLPLDLEEAKGHGLDPESMVDEAARNTNVGYESGK
jgi:hypothetical protein